jgi:hypothetical protein
MTPWILKIVKYVFVLLLIAIMAFVGVYVIYNQPLPTGKPGLEADALATKMLKAVNYNAYKNTRYLEWTYRKGAHKYVWDKHKGSVKVTWKNYIIDLTLGNHTRSIAFKDGKQLKGNEKDELVNKAIAFFNNDSFWLVAPYKVFDKGVKRSLVILDDDTEALLVTFQSGGSTPGDSYLWKLQPNGFPQNFQMWVKILPIGGLKASWDDWQVMESGAFLPKSHTIGPITLDMGEVRGYN